MPVLSALRRPEKGGFQVQGQPGLNISSRPDGLYSEILSQKPTNQQNKTSKRDKSAALQQLILKPDLKTK